MRLITMRWFLLVGRLFLLVFLASSLSIIIPSCESNTGPEISDEEEEEEEEEDDEEDES